GRAVESRAVPAGQTSFRLEKEVTVDRSSWYAFRAAGAPARGVVRDGIPRAHSGAIYVEVGGDPVLVREDLEFMLRWLDRLWGYLVERNNFGPGQNRERARTMIEQAREYYRAKLLVAAKRAQ